MGPDYILESAASRRCVFSAFSVKNKVFPGRVNEQRRCGAAGGGSWSFSRGYINIYESRWRRQVFHIFLQLLSCSRHKRSWTLQELDWWFVATSRSLTTRHLKHLQGRLNEQSHPELRHKIQCEQRFSASGSGIPTGSNEAGSGSLMESLDSRIVNGSFNVVDPDAAAAEKHLLRIIRIIIIVIIIILWYNKDIQLPVQAQWGVQWFAAAAMVQWSPLGFSLSSTHL